jgi:hypothetical protein
LKMPSGAGVRSGRSPSAPSRRRARVPAIRRTPRLAEPRQLYEATDHGSPVLVEPERFAPPQRGGGWGAFVEPFLRANVHALSALDVEPEVKGGPGGALVQLRPGGRAGAIPLRSAQTGQVVAGFVVKPRFGWAGVGRVLSQTGWHAAPEFLDLPLVPGSGREVPPWVLAGPVLARLVELLRALRRGYRDLESLARHPRGRILWQRYWSESITRGHWERLPCRFPDLDFDPLLRREIRWTLEKIHQGLIAVGADDPMALALATLAVRLLEGLADVPPSIPRRDVLRLALSSSRPLEARLRRGLEAISWILEERGLGGGRELDGLAWQLSLDRLWEAYVEAVVRREAAEVGGDVKVARLRETTFPLNWTDPSHRSLGHLAPDIVVRRGRSIKIVDAKYKAHLAELDDAGWHRFSEETRETHRADLHQVLAYAALYDAEDVTATLVYPLRRATWEVLRHQSRDISRAELRHGGRRVTLELQGLPFGSTF